MKAWRIIILVLGTLLVPGDGSGAPLAGKTSLSSMIEIATENHPEIEALRARVQAAHGRWQAAPTIPPPTFSLGVTGENGPLNPVGRMENAIEINQSIPFPTKLTAESRARALEEQAAEQDLHARLRALRAEVRVAYFELYRARELQALQADRHTILEGHAKRLRAATLSDRLVQAHVVRIDTEIALSENEIEKAAQEAKVAQASLNVLLGRDPSTVVPALEEPALPDLPRGDPDSSLLRNPRLRAIEVSTQALGAEMDRARSEWLPNFMVRYRSNRRFDGVMPNNQELMVGVELPFLFFWQPRGRSTEASARSTESRALLRKTENDLKLELVKARTSAESLHSQIRVYDKRILPQAERRLKITHGIAPIDMESLTEHRESMESFVDLKIAALALRADYEKAIATLEKLLPEQSIGQSEEGARP